MILYIASRIKVTQLLNGLYYELIEMPSWNSRLGGSYCRRSNCCACRLSGNCGIWLRTIRLNWQHLFIKMASVVVQRHWTLSFESSVQVHEAGVWIYDKAIVVLGTWWERDGMTLLWFLDQWIEYTAIMTYLYSYSRHIIQLYIVYHEISNKGPIEERTGTASLKSNAVKLI